MSNYSVNTLHQYIEYKLAAASAATVYFDCMHWSAREGLTRSRAL